LQARVARSFSRRLYFPQPGGQVPNYNWVGWRPLACHPLLRAHVHYFVKRFDWPTLNSQPSINWANGWSKRTKTYYCRLEEKTGIVYRTCSFKVNPGGHRDKRKNMWKTKQRKTTKKLLDKVVHIDGDEDCNWNDIFYQEWGTV
jgi:hypothetical protein